MVVIDQASVDLLDHQFIEDLRHSRQGSGVFRECPHLS
jgi:hypothetical protein